MVAAAYVLLLTLDGIYLVSLLVDVSPALDEWRHTHFSTIIVSWWIAWLVCVALLVLDAVFRARAGDLARLRRSMAIVKFGSVPFFVVNFFVSALMLFGTVVLPLKLGLVGLSISAALWWIAVLVTFVLFLPTSIHSIALAILLGRRRPEQRRSIIALGISQILFVLDLVGAILMLILSRPPKPAAPQLVAADAGR